MISYPKTHDDTQRLISTCEGRVRITFVNMGITEDGSPRDANEIMDGVIALKIPYVVDLFNENIHIRIGG